MGAIKTIKVENIHKLPDRPGVYRFYGPHGELLYVGKSVHVRTRVRDHFRKPGDTIRKQRLYKNTAEIRVHPTPGEFGATVLELHDIKKHQPILNVQSRKKEKHTIAAEQTTEGYLYPALAETNEITTEQFDELLAIFTSRKQARGRIDELVKEHELCRQRLQMGTSRQNGPCFDYELGACRGACVGAETANAHNRRVREAFRNEGVAPWPYDGRVEVVDRDGDHRLVFVLEDWCVREVREVRNGTSEALLIDSPLTDQFNYDLYRRLEHFLFNQEDAEQFLYAHGD